MFHGLFASVGFSHSHLNRWVQAAILSASMSIWWSMSMGKSRAVYAVDDHIVIFMIVVSAVRLDGYRNIYVAYTGRIMHGSFVWGNTCLIQFLWLNQSLRILWLISEALNWLLVVWSTLWKRTYIYGAQIIILNGTMIKRRKYPCIKNIGLDV